MKKPRKTPVLRGFFVSGGGEMPALAVKPVQADKVMVLDAHTTTQPAERHMSQKQSAREFPP